MKENEVDICIIGAGVVGLALAYILSKYYKSIIVIDKEHTFGQHISSRNSEVIHSGFYYPETSLKATLCVKGNELLYEFAEEYKIRYKKCGKLIVACDNNEEKELLKVHMQSSKNGVESHLLTKEETKNKEPKLKKNPSLWIPSTGIIDSHGLMRTFEYLSKQNEVSFLYNYTVNQIEKNKNKFQVYFKNNQMINSRIVINTAGLWADIVSKFLGVSSYDVEYYKGDYYKCNTLRNLNCLIYPLPSIKSLGLHSVLNLNDEVSFGPNIYKVNEINYSIDDRYKNEFINQINKYFNIKDKDIFPDFSGIRPKIKYKNNFNDFIIKNEKDKGFPNFINLIGIDSPGLTSCLAIAKYVKNLLLN